MNEDAKGTTVMGTRNVWTGGSANTAPTSCSNWSDGGQFRLVGDLTAKDSQWLSARNVSCSTDAHVYCFEK